MRAARRSPPARAARAVGCRHFAGGRMTEPRMPTITIRHRYTDVVLYEHETTQERIDSGLAMRDALEAANRTGASLDGASLDGASLYRASLDGASLDGASLDGASLVGASLDGASLYRASLDGARLDGARLDGASLVGAKLVGQRPVLLIGPIGSRCAYLTAYLTDAGIRIRAGCWFGSDTEFEARVLVEHAKAPQHRDEYLAALTLIRVHAQQWTAAEQSATREAA
ncbi:MAG: pentapeptide repeat-containing protein [Ideonella sp.]|nr:pentapeptide repeat-containing protein [Ideonella sp.]